VVSLLGELVVHGAYYHCGNCSYSEFFGRLVNGPGNHKLTPAATQAICRCSCQEGFERSADTLYELSGIRLSEERSRQVAEDVGADIGQRLGRGETFGDWETWPWRPDETGATCAYISLDATGILMQGPNGAKAEGRMPNVAMIYLPAEENQGSGKPAPGKARYVAGLLSLEELGPILRSQASQVGVHQATQCIALSDGGNGLDHFFEVNFPNCQRILDFYHAAEHLSDFAKLVHADDNVQAEELFATWRHQLRHEGGRAMLKTLLNFYVQDRSVRVQESHRCLIEYVSSNIHRMDYATYAAKGWQIGSGPVEAACKTVINQRLCQSGMRWSETGGDAICHLRALYRSDSTQWKAYWKSHYAVAA
jgi:hypothetical protein